MTLLRVILIILTLFPAAYLCGTMASALSLTAAHSIVDGYFMLSFLAALGIFTYFIYDTIVGVNK